MKERSYYLDVIRTLACIMVIVMHSPIPNTDAEANLLLGVVSYLTAPCIGLFFMVSGALLLPVKIDLRTFLTKRLSKVLWPTLFWSLFYIACNLLARNTDNYYFLKSLLGLPFAAQGHGILWFMYTMIGLYLLAPILSAWIEKTDQRMIKLYLVLWGITLCFPFVRLFIDIPLGEGNILYYFSGYAGYFLLGYYLNKNVKKKICLGKKYYLFGTMGLGIVFLPPILCKVNQYVVDFYSLFWYLSIGVAVMCIAWFVVLRKVYLFQEKNRITCVFADISNMTFGIYLIHIFIMRYILWNWSVLQSLPFMLQIPLCSLLTFGLSYLIIKCISIFSISKYIIGC